jgi:hypothetical protein
VIEILSFWRNDADRQLETRAVHLLAKISERHEIRWLWMIGDSTDLTEKILTKIAADEHPAVRLLRHDTGIVGEGTETRRRRGSVTATAAFAEISEEADFALLHESDLITPFDIADQLLESGGGQPTAGWPVIELNGKRQFYDIWAYRDLRGRPFDSHPPYAKGYRRAGRFKVGSFGSCWLVPAEILRGRVIEKLAVIELCKQWRAEGIDLWVDPRIIVEQPTELWP